MLSNMDSGYLWMSWIFRHPLGQKGKTMAKVTGSRSWSTTQALAIMAVDNIEVSTFAKDVLKRLDEGLLSYEEAKEQILRRAKLRVKPVPKL